MPKDQIQILTSAIEGTVKEEMLSVEYWRQQLLEKATQFSSVREIADGIAKLDSDFEGVSGYFKVQNAHNGRAGLKVTAKIVHLMDRILAAK